MAQHVKTFNFEVLGTKNIQSKRFNILGHLPGWLGAKSFDFE